MTAAGTTQPRPAPPTPFALDYAPTPRREPAVSGRAAAAAVAVVAALIGAWWARSYSFVVFHCFAELICVVISAATFVVAWNTRRYHASLWVLLLGVTLLSVGVLDLFHMLAYRGMAVFSGSDANTSPVLWIASRYLMSLSLVAAALLVGVGSSPNGVANLVRSPLSAGLLAFYAAATTVLLLAVFEWNLFPICYVEGVGLTPFKKASEYAISGVLVLSGLLFWLRRERIDPQVFRLLLAAIAVSVATQLCFTLYQDVYGLLNWVGHLLKLGSYVLLYGAIVVVGTQRPYALLFRDLGRRERELRDAKTQAEEANSAKDQFLAVLSHELRNPLNPVLAHVSALQTRDDLPCDVREDLRVVRRNVELEARLIDDLLDLTRIAQGKLQLTRGAVDVHELVGQALGICRDEAKAKRLTVDVALDARGHTVDADAARLLQVLWNVLKNAVKFSAADGRVGVRTSDRDGTLRLTVADSGIGINPEQLHGIFDAFAQGGPAITRAFGGLGLGLSISRALVEAHGGRIWAESDGIGRGASFHVELAAVAAPAAEPATPPEQPMPNVAESMNLLLVEDHVDTAKVMARLLRALGHRVTVAHTVAEGLAAADAAGFDLVVSDLGLPDGSGLDMMSALRDGHDLRGICLSGFGMDDDLRRSGEAGFLEHLVKPVSLESLSAALSRVASRAA